MTARQAAPADGAASLGVLAIVFGALLAATWVIGFVVYEVVAARHARELQAIYVPVDAGARLPGSTTPEFIALRGLPHPRGFMTLGTSSSTDKAAYVPLLARGAAPGEPVRWIVKSSERWVRALPAVIHVHARDEALAPIVREGFEKMGVVLATDVQVVEQVATRAGRVVDQSAEDWEHLLWLASFASAIMVLLWLTSSAILWWKGRSARAPARRTAVS